MGGGLWLQETAGVLLFICSCKECAGIWVKAFHAHGDVLERVKSGWLLFIMGRRKKLGCDGAWLLLALLTWEFL